MIVFHTPPVKQYMNTSPAQENDSRKANVRRVIQLRPVMRNDARVPLDYASRLRAMHRIYICHLLIPSSPDPTRRHRRRFPRPESVKPV